MNNVIKKNSVFGYKSYFRECQNITLLKNVYWQKKVLNTGNEIFCVLTTRPLNILDCNLYPNAEYAQDDNNCLICLPANIFANHAKESLIKLTELIEQYKCRMFIASIGAQATLEEMNNPKKYAENLIPEAKKFAKLISSKSISIGARGEFTYNVLQELGIKNVDCIGCPSYFVNGFNQTDIYKKDWSKKLKVGCFAVNTNDNLWPKQIMSEALQLNDTKYIMQSEFKILPYYFFTNNHLFTGLKCIKDLKSSMKYIKKMFGISYKDMLFNNKVQNLFEIFLNINKWEDFIKTRDFVFGMRIHGSIIALKQGIPAMVIAHDSRLIEMCDLFNIPYIRIDAINPQDFNLQKFYEESDYTLMNKNYTKLLENYISFLDKNEIQHSFR